MALTSDEKSMIFAISMQMLQQDMLTNSLFAGGQVGKDLRDLALDIQKDKTEDPNSVNDAINGTFEADISAYKQASKNVKDAGAIFGSGVTSLQSVKGYLTQMKTLTDNVASGKTVVSSQADLDKIQATLDQYTASIKSILDTASYDGMSLFNGAQWSSDERTQNGGAIQIQIGPDSGDTMTIQLQDLSTFTNDFTASGTKFNPYTSSADAVTDAAAISSFLDTASTSIQTYVDTYTAKQDSLNNQSTSLLSQADVLQAVVDNRTKDYSSGQSIAQMLLDYVLSDSGKIVDQST